MKLVVGLGNIGSKYIATRHNVGFRVVDALASKFSIFNFQFSKKFQSEISEGDNLILVKPTTLMNLSGVAVAKLVNFYKIEPGFLYVIHDDLDITLGEYKIQLGKGPKVHNGVTSVEKHLGTAEFWRVRVGVDGRTAQQRAEIAGMDYVLGKFSGEEKKVIDEVVDKVVEELAVRLV